MGDTHKSFFFFALSDSFEYYTSMFVWSAGEVTVIVCVCACVRACACLCICVSRSNRFCPPEFLATMEKFITAHRDELPSVVVGAAASVSLRFSYPLPVITSILANNSRLIWSMVSTSFLLPLAIYSLRNGIYNREILERLFFYFDPEGKDPFCCSSQEKDDLVVFF